MAEADVSPLHFISTMFTSSLLFFSFPFFFFLFLFFCFLFYASLLLLLLCVFIYFYPIIFFEWFIGVRSLHFCIIGIHFRMSGSGFRHFLLRLEYIYIYFFFLFSFSLRPLSSLKEIVVCACFGRCDWLIRSVNVRIRFSARSNWFIGASSSDASKIWASDGPVTSLSRDDDNCPSLTIISSTSTTATTTTTSAGTKTKKKETVTPWLDNQFIIRYYTERENLCDLIRFWRLGGRRK